MIAGLLAFKSVQTAVIFTAVIAVAIADMMIKKAAVPGDLRAALSSPWLFGAAGLYLLQILLFTLIFCAGWKLSVIGALQTALYALVVLSAGVFLFNERLSRLQVLGILLAAAGIALIHWGKWGGTG